jgi:DinB superfamily
MSVPGRDEAAPYYFTYIDRIGNDDIVGVLASQLEEVPAFLSQISEQKSLHRYAPDKWSFRQVLNHINDTERTFTFRALWFGRGFNESLASFDQNIAANGARADDYSWASHVADFRDIRRATLSFFRSLPEEAWPRKGVASGNPVTVRALAYIIAGHLSHHIAILQERYL